MVRRAKEPVKRATESDQMDVDQPQGLIRRMSNIQIESSKKPRIAQLENEIVGDVYVFGSGDCGQLGLGEDVDSRKRPTVIPYLQDKNIVSISAGGMHTLALSLDGKVYSWGCNDEKALGHSAPEFSVGLVSGLSGEKIVQVAAGDSISAALTEDGRVFAWGTFRDSRGIMGFSDKAEMQVDPVLVSGLVGEKIVKISAGANHLTALSSANKVYSWGCGEQGQLGRKVLERHRMKGLVPHNVTLSTRSKKINTKFTQIVCGSYHTLAINQLHNVFSYGLNNYGQLGLNDYENRLLAEMIDPSYFNNENVVSLGAGEHHSIALTENGNIYSFGRGDSGQLGHPEEENYPFPKKIEGISNVQMIATGGTHNLAVTKEGKLFSWGYGEMQQLGNGKEEDEPVPYQVDFPHSILSIKAGGQHSVLLVKKQ